MRSISAAFFSYQSSSVAGSLPFCQRLCLVSTTRTTSSAVASSTAVSHLPTILSRGKLAACASSLVPAWRRLHSRASFSTFARSMAASSSQSSPPSMNGSDMLASFATPPIGTNVAHAMEMLSKADAVCLDVDSTVICEEGIDVLGDFLGKGAEIEALTKSAMEGTQKFQDALAARLELLQPSEHAIRECLKATPLELSPGVESFIETLILNHVDVYLVSGGFRIMIEPIARQLCVAKDHIYANAIFFDDEGNYAGFDEAEPTSADMGKPKALEMIKAKGNYETMVMIGDGATDAQAKPPADAFIGFGGVVTRDIVKEKACWFVTDFQDLETIVKKFGKNSGATDL